MNERNDLCFDKEKKRLTTHSFRLHFFPSTKLRHCNFHCTKKKATRSPKQPRGASLLRTKPACCVRSQLLVCHDCCEAFQYSKITLKFGCVWINLIVRMKCASYSRCEWHRCAFMVSGAQSACRSAHCHTNTELNPKNYVPKQHLNQSTPQ